MQCRFAALAGGRPFFIPYAARTKYHTILKSI